MSSPVVHRAVLVLEECKDKDLTPHGVSQLKLPQGLVAGKAQIQ
jgi:hypothetical protein